MASERLTAVYGARPRLDADGPAAQKELMTSPRARFDVAVCGAGPAGATLALAAARAGLSVALLDAEPVDARLEPNFDGRAWAIASGNMAQYRALGIAEALEAEGEPVTGIRVSDGAAPGAAAHPRALAALGFDAADIALETADAPLAVMVENRRLRAALHGAVLEAGVSALAPARVERCDPVPGGVRLGLSDGRSVEAAVAVGADGRNSMLRRLAGIGVNGWRYGQSGVVATVKLAGPHHGFAYEHFMPGSALAVLPLPGQRASLVWVETPARARALLEGSDAAFEAHLNRRLGEGLGPATLEGGRFGYPLSLQIAERMTGPRLALIGDAAHAVHPIAGQGLNLGLKDAAALAEVLADAKAVGEDLGGEVTLARYARWRRLDRAAFALATDFFVRAYGSDTAPLRLLRSGVTGVMNRSRLVKRTMMLEAAGALGDPPKLLRGLAL
jgi:2-octaprenyl-6-methoxyphenol hydroxylase